MRTMSAAHARSNIPLTHAHNGKLPRMRIATSYSHMRTMSAAHARSNIPLTHAHNGKLPRMCIATSYLRRRKTESNNHLAWTQNPCRVL
ncbi:Hypothetical predicted protein [Pelobates cultripes]|uniref:Uncharacterized protein n=1 Tax=Pelobates cultripes TaxID=61616 RepID=A0AAD1VI76_PELCU|nr:Hypothetical predicted protein [Pelobates cultripes]